MTQRLITAIDTPDKAKASALIRAVAPHCGLIKLGLEFFAANGPAGLKLAEGIPVFLDLKLHDIPNTVAGAVRALAPLGVEMLTIHAGGGGAMIGAAVEAAARREKPPKILAVTVLTSLDDPALAKTGVPEGTKEQVLRLARLALENGVDGLVCSAHELAALRSAFGAKPILVVPGIRPPGSDFGDQSRVMTPEQAIAAGADYIVVGRPITGAENPGTAASVIAESVRK
jgi:orotidine-5'-phosphate decarboxylase